MKFAVIGHPVAHSLSPKMHAANFAAIGFDGTYEKFDVAPEDVESFVRGKQREGYAGLNVTVPHKLAVIPLLDHVDESVARYGACNTLKFETDGTITGYNTDVIGFVDVLRAHGRSLAGKKVFIVGCGGAGGALAGVCCHEKAASLVLADLDAARVHSLAEKLNALGTGTQVATLTDKAAWASAAAQAEIVVNATPLGLHPGEPSALPPEAFHPGQFVLDIVPTATLPPTAAAAKAAGADATDGLEFLVGQGAKSFELWTGVNADRAAMLKSLRAPAAPVRRKQWIAILDYGSQYTQLIARRIREQEVYSEIIRCDTTAAELAANPPAGIILSGGPNSVFEEGAPTCDPALFELGVPVLGICYGMQLMSQRLGGRVVPGVEREYGKMPIEVLPGNPLFDGIPGTITVWMSHGDRVEAIPASFERGAVSATCPFAAMFDNARRLYALQFHPEVVHTQYGTDILKNFVFGICGCRKDWKLSTWVEDTVARMRGQIGNDEVVLGLSGGVDSSVVAVLLNKAIGRRLHCIFVDNGLLRWREAEQVEEMFRKNLGLDLTVVRAADRFYAALKGVDEPEAKRKIIGKLFIDVFAEEARRFKDCRYLGQGTIYPDVIESRSPRKGPSHTIKSHHNVGGLPPDLKFELVEPLKELFKDEVRAVGRVLGMADELLDRQPFPGPGLGVRILGEVTREKVELLQQADVRVQEEIRKLPDYKTIWQTFAVLLPVRSVGVMGDQRTYEYTCAIRSVNSIDAMTADWTRIPYETLARMSNRIINEVRGINRVVYDISSKPPATIEWE